MTLLEKVENFKYIEDTERLLKSGGLFLVSKGKRGPPNAMTIGWGLIGTMWSQPFFVVAVRYSRYTYQLIEESGKFSVCLPTKNMHQALQLCGSKSGRDIDKLKELGLNTAQGKIVDTPYIKECPVIYECEVAFKTQIKNGEILKEIEDAVYKSGDYHSLYYGWIKGVYSIQEAEKHLP